jgi:hypothetical protein
MCDVIVRSIWDHQFREFRPIQKEKLWQQVSNFGFVAIECNGADKNQTTFCKEDNHLCQGTLILHKINF